jgi:hypothetical protein
MILAKFRHQYPQGSLVSELVQIDRGTYIVKALVQIDSIVLATALAGATTVEAAEDAAKERAIATLFLDHQPDTAKDVASMEAQLSPPTSIKPGIKSEGTSNHKIVNFSKPQSAPVIPNPVTTAAEMPLPIVPTEASFPQLDIAPEAPVESSAVNPEMSSPPPTETNLFGDTFTAETPSVTPFPEKLTEELTKSEEAPSSYGGVSLTAEGGQTQALPLQGRERLTNVPATVPISSEVEAMDFNEIKQKTDIEIKRLSWTKDQGKEFLMSRYGKRSRLHLTDEQLLEFLRYLETLPNPVK